MFLGDDEKGGCIRVRDCEMMNIVALSRKIMSRCVSGGDVLVGEW